MNTFLINGSYMGVIRFLFQIQVTDIDLSIVLNIIKYAYLLQKYLLRNNTLLYQRTSMFIG